MESYSCNPSKKPTSGIHAADKVYRWLTGLMVRGMQGEAWNTSGCMAKEW